MANRIIWDEPKRKTYSIKRLTEELVELFKLILKKTRINFKDMTVEIK